jgi:hypothetical protein
MEADGGGIPSRVEVRTRRRELTPSGTRREPGSVSWYSSFIMAATDAPITPQVCSVRALCTSRADRRIDEYTIISVRSRVSHTSGEPRSNELTPPL